jgi:thiol-disulfide isomerase/thioredoxin
LGAASRKTFAAPNDPRGADLLYSVGKEQKDFAKRSEVYRRLIAGFPDSNPAKLANGEIRQVEGLGKPFELEFTDAISGRPVSVKNLRGKIVVIDFWATWCAPCVAEMPRMKELYAKYKDQGVEFIGVNLDEPESEGGLTALKTFVAQNQIAWPQYYQGKGWESEFSRDWGVSGIPRLFAVDHRGNLRSNDVGPMLEEAIQALIAQRGKTAK